MSMKPFKRLISRIEATKIIMESVQRVDRIEPIHIEEASGRVLAVDVIAGFNVPPFDRSSMDGYGVKAKDTYGASNFNQRKLKLIGVQHAGEKYEGTIGKGECVQVATGSPIPDGCDAVVMVEFTKVMGDIIEVYKPVYPKANISPEGEDIIKGEVVLKAGEVITPAKVGVLAALNKETVEVLEKPTIAVFSTGSEIRTLGSVLKPGQIYDINSYTVSSVAKVNGCTPILMGIVEDNKEAIAKAIKQAEKYDIAVFSGGSSVGVRDLFAEIVEDMGDIYFHGVQVKPGKPTLFGTVGGTHVFGMPGYPTSCLSNTYIFLAPALRKLAGLNEESQRTVKARMSMRFVSGSGREQFLTVRLENGVAHPVFKKSGAITSMADADGYIVLPVNLDVIEEGEEVTVTLLE